MRATLIIIGLLIATVAHGQTTTTIYDLSTGRIVAQDRRDSGLILIQRGNTVVTQTFPPDYYYGGGGNFVHRSHYFYGRSFRGYYRGTPN
jgi:hypothetical protein